MADRAQKLLAIAMILVGASQAVSAVAYESLSWVLFFALFGLSIALIGGASLWAARRPSGACTAAH